MVKIAIIVGSTRPGRKAEAVAQWVHGFAKTRQSAEYEVVDIADFHLPLLDEPIPPMMSKYQNAHTIAWSKKIAEYDGYVFVTPEYNHGPSGALKNAIDYLLHEWGNKAAAFVSYGSAGGARAVEQLRLVLAEVKIATVRAQVMLSLHNDFENYTTFKSGPHHERAVHATLDEVEAWSGALKSLRAK